MLSFLLLSSAIAFSSTDVSAKFYHYAKGFCNGGVKNADIGNGNLVNQFGKLEAEHMGAFKLGAMHSKLSDEEFAKLDIMPGKNDTTLSSCNERDGNTCKKSGGLYHWCNYSSYKCMSRYAGQNGAVTYSHMNKQTAIPETYEVYYDNAEDAETSATVTKDMSTTNTNTISTTYGFQIGAELSISAGEPGIFSASEKFSWSFDMHRTKTDTKETTDDFKWEGVIPESALSTTMLQFTVTKVSYSGAWKAKIDLPHSAKLWCGSRTKGHYEHFVSAKTFMGKGPYITHGVFTGGSGLSMHASVRNCPLWSTTVEQCSNKTGLIFAKDHLNAPAKVY